MIQQTSPFYVVRSREIRDGFERLRREILDPWAIFSSGAPISITSTRGQTVNYAGGVFEGEPRAVFWSGFLLDCVEDLIAEEIEKTRLTCVATDYFQPLALDETADLLRSGTESFLQRMAEIDRLLLGKGLPQAVPRRPIETEAAQFKQTINRHLGEAKQRLQLSSPGWLARNATWIAVIAAIAVGALGILFQLFDW